MDTVELLEEIAKRKDPSKGQVREAVALLLQLFSETDGEGTIAEYIMRIKKPDACLFFFEDAVKRFDSDRIQKLFAAIRSSEAYIKNAGKSGTVRGFIVAAVLIKNNLNLAMPVLAQTLADVEKKGKYSDDVIQKFIVAVVNYCGSLNVINAFFEREWQSEEDRKRINGFMQIVSNRFLPPASSKTQDEIEPVDQGIIKIDSDDSTNKSLHVVETNVTESDTKHIETQAAPIPDIAKSQTDALLKVISDATKEVEELMQTLTGGNGTIEILRQQVAVRDSQISDMLVSQEKKDKEIKSLKQSKDEMDSQISDLTNRLKLSRQMDNFSQNQELITLKTNLSNSLKVEYADYLTVKNSEITTDTAGRLLGSLNRIYKILRINGISVD